MLTDQDELVATGERSIAMDKHRILQEANDKETFTTNNNQSPVLTHPANPNSWFRQRLDHVRSEARKELQLKSIRPLDEK